jgi:hypothetical protein
MDDFLMLWRSRSERLKNPLDRGDDSIAQMEDKFLFLHICHLQSLERMDRLAKGNKSIEIFCFAVKTISHFFWCESATTNIIRKSI